MRSIKRILTASILLAILIMQMLWQTAWAFETALITTVPTEVVINIEVEGKGYVIANGIEHFGTFEMTVNRNDNISLRFVPNDGYVTNIVKYNGTEITDDLYRGTLNIRANSNSVLRVKFEKMSFLPETGESYYLKAVLCAMLVALIFIAVLYKLNKKEQL